MRLFINIVLLQYVDFVIIWDWIGIIDLTTCEHSPTVTLNSVYAKSRLKIVLNVYF